MRRAFLLLLLLFIPIPGNASVFEGTNYMDTGYQVFTTSKANGTVEIGIINVTRDGILVGDYVVNWSFVIPYLPNQTFQYSNSSKIAVTSPVKNSTLIWRLQVWATGNFTVRIYERASFTGIGSISAGRIWLSQTPVDDDSSPVIWPWILGFGTVIAIIAWRKRK